MNLHQVSLVDGPSGVARQPGKPGGPVKLKTPSLLPGWWPTPEGGGLLAGLLTKDTRCRFIFVPPRTAAHRTGRRFAMLVQLT